MGNRAGTGNGQEHRCVGNEPYVGQNPSEDKHHYQEIMDRDNFVTAEKVKNAFLGLEHRCHTLMKVYEQFTADYAKMVEAGMKSKKSYEKYLVVYKHLKKFLYGYKSIFLW